MTDSNDRYNQLCTKCGVGRYHETSLHDDWDGVLHCTNKACNHEVGRYKFNDNPPPKPKMVKLSPVAQTVLDAFNREARPEPHHQQEAIAAALRAAADQVLEDWNEETYDKLLAIATELEAQAN